MREVGDRGKPDVKLCIVASEGGHLTEALHLLSAYQGHDFFFISYRCPRVEALSYRRYMLPMWPDNLLLALPSLWLTLRALLKERPDAIVSTGSEIAIPAFVLAKLFGIKTVFIETITRFENATLTGRILYPLSDRFFVQNPESLKAYGPKAEYHGGVA